MPFDPADPVNTPNTLNTADSDVVAAVRQALADGVQVLLDNDIALDAPWGEVQVQVKNGERIPVHGGSGDIGVFGAIGVGLSDTGYLDPGGGNSYIQAVTWDATECPIADVIITHSNSSDPASPHYSDQSRLYADKEWVRFPFCEPDIEAGQVGDTLVVEE